MTLSMNENKTEWRNPKSVQEERSRALFSPHRGNHEQTYPRSKIRIELKSWPSQLKRFTKVQEILPQENGRVSRRDGFFSLHYVVCRLVVESDAIKPTVLPYKYRIAKKIEEERSPAKCGQKFLFNFRKIYLTMLCRRNQPHSSKVPGTL